MRTLIDLDGIPMEVERIGIAIVAVRLYRDLEGANLLPHLSARSVTRIEQLDSQQRDRLVSA